MPATSVVGGQRAAEQVVVLSGPGHSGVSWVKSWLPAPVSPAAEPYSTLTAPAWGLGPTPSVQAPAASSARLSPSKSPTASLNPSRSPISAVPGTPGLFWVRSRLPAAVSPAGDPASTATAPAAPALPTASPIAPAAKASSTLSDSRA
jgi:hypothetical protein